MADPFVIYTLGDTALFDGALNAIAMLFKDTDLLKGNGYLGLGFGAFFGAAILLCIMVYNAAFKQQMEIKSLIAPLVVYIILTVPKVDVAISDVYTGQVRKVDNIPIGLAIPASVASGISKILTDIFETAYQVVDNNQSYMPRITQDGYVTPLKILNNLRLVANSPASPFLIDNTKNFYQKCIYRNPSFNPETLSKSTDIFAHLKSVSTSNQLGGGVVNINSVTSGGMVSKTTVSCLQAARSIEANVYAYIDGQNVSALFPNMIGNASTYNLKKALQTQMVASGDATGATSALTSNILLGGQGYTPTDVLNAYAQLAHLSEADARKFTANTLFNPILKTASYCAEKNGDLAQLSKCTAWVSATNQWEEKNAAAGTGFLKVMKDGQNILIMLSFLLFPIIVIFVMVQGQSSFKILGNYISFTVAAYLWLPLASIINFYIQTTLSDEFYKITMANGGVPELNMITGPQFYAAVSQKLSLANGLLASVPVLSMALFSGMMMGMGALTSRMNSADGGDYDAKVNNPDAVKSAPIASSNSAVSGNGAGVFKASGSSTSSVNFSQSASAIQAQQSVISDSQQVVAANRDSLVKSIGAMASRGQTASANITNQDASSSGETSSTGTAIQSGEVTNTAAGTNQSLGSNQAQTSASAGVVSENSVDQGGVAGRVQGSMKPQLDKNGKPTGKDRAGVTPAIGGNLAHSNISMDAQNDAKSSGVTVSDAQSAQINAQKALQDQYNKVTNFGKNTNISNSELSSLMRSAENTQQFSKAVQADTNMSKMWSDTKSALNSISTAQQNIAGLTTSLSGDTQSIATNIMRSPEQMNALRSEINALPEGQRKEFEQIKANQRDTISRTGQIAGGDQHQIDGVATTMAALQMGGSVGQAAANVMGGGYYNAQRNQLGAQVGTTDAPNATQLRGEVKSQVEGIGEALKPTEKLRDTVPVPQAHNIPANAINSATNAFGGNPNEINPAPPKRTLSDPTPHVPNVQSSNVGDLFDRVIKDPKAEGRDKMNR